MGSHREDTKSLASLSYDPWDIIFQVREFFRFALQKLNKLNSPDLELIRASMQQLSAWMTVRIGFVNEGIKGLSECLEIFRLHNSADGIPP